MPDNVYDAIIGCAEDLKSGAEVNREAWLDYIVRYANEAKSKEADLRRRLKVAEDALDSAWMYADKLPHQWPLPERVRTKMKNAIAAIREKGGQDGK